MRDVLVIADPTTADVFRLSDVDVQSVTEPDTAKQLLRSARSQPYLVIFVADAIAAAMQDEIRAAQRREGPIVVVIPGVGSAGVLGKDMLGQLRQVVVGT